MHACMHARMHARKHVHTHKSAHTHVQTGTWMFMQSQTDRHTCPWIDGKLKYIQINRNCIIMYIDNVRNIHARACQGIHARVIFFKFPMKMKGPIETKLFYFHRLSKNGGHGGGSRTPWTQTGSATALYMFANAQIFWLHHTWACNSYVLQKIYGQSCLINLGRVVL